MKGKTVLIVVAILVVLLIVFFIWRSKKQRELAIQAQQQQLYNQMNQYGPGNLNGNQNTGGLAGTMDSVGGVINSLTGLFGAFQGSGIGSGFGGSNGSANNGAALIWNGDFNSNDGRLAIANSVNADASSATVNYHLAGVFSGTANDAATAQADHEGNIRVDSSGDIFIYVA